MHTKIILFALVGMSLVLAVYSFSIYVGYAASTKCTYNKEKTHAECQNIDEDYDVTNWVCDKNPDGKTWNCHQAATGEEPSSEDSKDALALNKALDAAIGESQNTTKVPKGSFLDDGGLLKGQGDNQTTSQRIVGPEDRFCLEGTGILTGSPCVPCNPGNVDCIDVLTGGLLDMPDTATSEETDDTNPKDLDGLNNDENGPEVNPGE